MTSIRFNREFVFQYGVIERLSPLVRRVVANNPGPFTFHGTSTFLVGNRRVAVIDPGPAIPSHVEAIIDGLEGESISHIIATHTHADHSPACRLLQEITGAPTYGFGPHATHSAGALEGGVDRDFVPDNFLRDSDTLSGLDWHLRAIHTLGHCSNHLCLALPEENTIFCGDQLMAWSTTIILPPDGSVKDYITSLKALKKRPETIYRPTHGDAIDNPRLYIDQVVAHRLQRVEQVFAAVRAGCEDIPSMRARIYQGLNPVLYPGAELSILGSLYYLIDQGLIVQGRINQGEDMSYPQAATDAIFCLAS